MRTPNWDDLKTVLALIQHGTLAGAAAELGLSYTTVARRVARLEAALDELLFERLADGYRPTPAAHLVAEHAAEMQTHEDALARRLAGRDQRLAGGFTVTAPQLIITHFLTPVLRDFTAAHPEIELTVRATNDILDLTRRQADVAVRVSRNPGDTLKGLRLSGQRNGWFLHKDIAAGLTPATPLDVITFVDYPSLPEGLTAAYPKARIRYVMDDMIAIFGAVRAGLGAARLPFFLGGADPDLVRLEALRPQPYLDVWLLAHPDLWPSAKVRAFRDVVTKHSRSSRSLFLGPEEGAKPN